MNRIWLLRLLIKTLSRKLSFGVLALFVAAVLFPLAASAQGDAEDRQDAVAIFNEAQDAHEKGDLPAAIELYKKAIKILPEFAEAEYQIGNPYLSLKDRVAAEAAFRKALEIRPDWTLPMSSLGSLLVQKG